MEETTAIINISPGQDEVVQSLRGQILRAKEYAEQCIITSPEELKSRINDLSIIANLKKAIEEKRQEYIGPVNAYAKLINETFKLLSVPLGEADKITRDKVLVYNAELERKRQEAEAIEREKLELARREEELTGEHTVELNTVDVPESAPKRVRTDLGTAGQRENWKYEVTDFAVLPDDYKMEDRVTLNAIAKKHHDQKVIPGVRFFNQPTLQVTTK